MECLKCFNVFWYLFAHITILISVNEHFKLVSLPFLQVQYFWFYCILLFLVNNFVLSYSITGFLYQTSVRSHLLGTVSAVGIHVALQIGGIWSVSGLYLCVLAFFHFSEFLAISLCNPTSLSISSFILNHSKEYWIAMIASWMEFAIEAVIVPSWKTVRFVSWLGLCMCVTGEILRKTAMITAAASFDHIVQEEKKKNHKLITHGIYSWCRHPSYLGWFLWSIGTQLLLLNPICAFAYTIVSWNFFRGRIIMEECYLINFFGEDYIRYQHRVGSGLPFIKGMIIDDTHRE